MCSKSIFSIQTASWFVFVAFSCLIVSTAADAFQVNPVQADSADWEQLESRLVKAATHARAATVAIELADGSGGASAVIVSPKGLVMTAGHCVIKPHTDFIVILHDGRSFPAKGLGLESSYDCGLIQIDEQALGQQEIPYAELGWSAELKPNQPIFSLGHGGEYNEARGAYLRFGRVVNACSENGFIESTCMMEPGDSGGPLFDLNGRVVGIHSMINQPEDENFDVPVDVYRRYWSQLNKPKKFRWNRAELNASFGIRLLRGRVGSSPKKACVRVTRVAQDSWAEQQGFEKSDLILSWAGVKPTNPKQLNMLMIKGLFLKEKSVAIVISRENKQVEMNVDFSKLSQSITNKFGQYRRQPEKLVQPIHELKNMQQSFASLEERLDDFAVIIENGEKSESDSKSFGMLVRLEGEPKAWVVAKSSLVESETPFVSLKEKGREQRIKSHVVARDPENDLALLKIKLDIPAINLGKELEKESEKPRPSLSVGKLLVSASPIDGGEVSVLGSLETDSRGRGFVGVIPKDRQHEFVVEEVTEGSPAEKAGIEAGDQITEVCGEKVNVQYDVIRILLATKVNQTIEIKILRDGKELELKTTLGQVPEGVQSAMEGTHIASFFAGGRSKVSGFPCVFLHDARVAAAECGGPVFDRDGKFLGMNIARASRTRTYLLPARIVREFVSSNQD